MEDNVTRQSEVQQEESVDLDNKQEEEATELDKDLDDIGV